VWAPDGQRIALVFKKEVQVWDVNTGQRLITYADHKEDVSLIAWAPDGRRIASTSKKAFLSKDKEVQVWNAITGQLLITYTSSSYSYSDDAPSLVMWAPDGQHIILLPGNRATEVWEVDTGRLIAIIEPWNAKPWGEGPVVWMPDGRHIGCVSYDGTVQMWDTGANVHPITYTNHVKHVFAIAWAPDGQRIASSSYEGVQVWDANTGRHLITYEGHKGTSCIAWAPDGQRIASVLGNEIQVWDANTGRCLITYAGHKKEVQVIAWAPDGRRIASGSKKPPGAKVQRCRFGMRLQASISAPIPATKTM